MDLYSNTMILSRSKRGVMSIGREEIASAHHLKGKKEARIHFVGYKSELT